MNSINKEYPKRNPRETIIRKKLMKIEPNVDSLQADEMSIMDRILVLGAFVLLGIQMGVLIAVIVTKLP